MQNKISQGRGLYLFVLIFKYLKIFSKIPDKDIKGERDDDAQDGENHDVLTHKVGVINQAISCSTTFFAPNQTGLVQDGSHYLVTIKQTLI